MLYDLLWYPFKILFQLYFKNVEIKRLNNAKHTGPTIFAATQPTSFMDAVALAMVIQTPLFFLISATMMRHILGRLFLSALHAIPIYSKKGGYKELHKNLHTFDRCRDILIQNKPIVIFSENAAQLKKKRFFINKGAARIAFSAEEIFDFKLGVQIVPVTLCYTSQKFRPNLIVSFGLPIKIKAFEVQYKDHPAKALKDLTTNIETSFDLIRHKMENEENGSLKAQMLPVPDVSLKE